MDFCEPEVGEVLLLLQPAPSAPTETSGAYQGNMVCLLPMDLERMDAPSGIGASSKDVTELNDGSCLGPREEYLDCLPVVDGLSEASIAGAGLVDLALSGDVPADAGQPMVAQAFLGFEVGEDPQALHPEAHGLVAAPMVRMALPEVEKVAADLEGIYHAALVETCPLASSGTVHVSNQAGTVEDYGLASEGAPRCLWTELAVLDVPMVVARDQPSVSSRTPSRPMVTVERAVSGHTQQPDIFSAHGALGSMGRFVEFSPLQHGFVGLHSRTLPLDGPVDAAVLADRSCIQGGHSVDPSIAAVCSSTSPQVLPVHSLVDVLSRPRASDACASSSEGVLARPKSFPGRLVAYLGLRAARLKARAIAFWRWHKILVEVAPSCVPLGGTA